MNVQLALNGKITKFNVDVDWSIAEFKSQVQDLLNLETCRIVGLPKLTKDKTEDNCRMGELALKPDIKLMCIGQVMSVEKIQSKKLETEKAKDTAYRQAYNLFIADQLKERDADIFRFQERRLDKIKSTKMRGTSRWGNDYKDLEYYKFEHACSLGLFNEAEIIYRNNSHKFDLLTLSYAIRTLNLAGVYGNCLQMVKYVLEHFHVKPIKDQPNNNDQAFARIQRLRDENKIEEADRDLVNLRERIAKQAQFAEAQEAIYANRLHPTEVLKPEGEFLPNLIRFGRFDILKYLLEEWVPKYYIPHFIDLSIVERHNLLARTIPPLRSYGNFVEDEADEAEFLREFKNATVERKTEQAYTVICVCLCRSLYHCTKYGGDLDTIFYVLNYLKNRRMLHPLLLTRLTMRAIACGNHYIYLELLNKWKPNYRIDPKEVPVIEWCIQNPTKSVVDLVFRDSNVKYFDELVLYETRRVELLTGNYIKPYVIKDLNPEFKCEPWTHWCAPESIMSARHSGSTLQHIDWLFEKAPCLLTWSYLECYLHTMIEIVYSVFTSEHKHFQKLPLLKDSTFQSTVQFYFHKWFFQSNYRLSDSKMLLKLLFWVMKNQYLNLTPAHLESMHPDVANLVMISQALCEKQELVADHLAKALSGRIDSIEQIARATHSGEIIIDSKPKFISYNDSMITFNDSFSRLVTYYMHGSKGYNYEVQLKNGKRMLGENWRDRFREFIETKRTKQLDDIDARKTRAAESLQSQLSRMDAWERMLVESRLQQQGGVGQATQVEMDLLNRKKCDLLQLTSNITDIDISDVQTLITLL